MSRLPKPGHDSENWGDVLNDFLLVSHNPDGTLKNNVPFSVKNFGAVGDGVADDSKAILATIRAALTVDRPAHMRTRAVIFPPGFYKITESIPLSAGISLCALVPYSAELLMAGRGPVIYSAKFDQAKQSFTSITNASWQDVANGTKAQSCAIYGLSIRHVANPFNPGDPMIDLNGMAPDQFVLEKIRIGVEDEPGSAGIRIQNSWRASLRDIYIGRRSSGRSLGPGLEVISCHNIQLDKVVTVGCWQTGTVIAGSHGVSVIGSNFEATNAVGLKIKSSYGVSVTGCYFEGNNVDIQLGEFPIDATARNVFFAGNFHYAARDAVVQFASATSCTFMEMYMETSGKKFDFSKTSGSSTYGCKFHLSAGDAADAETLASYGFDGSSAAKKAIIFMIGGDTDVGGPQQFMIWNGAGFKY